MVWEHFLTFLRRTFSSFIFLSFVFVSNTSQRISWEDQPFCTYAKFSEKLTFLPLKRTCTGFGKLCAHTNMMITKETDWMICSWTIWELFKLSQQWHLCAFAHEKQNCGNSRKKSWAGTVSPLDHFRAA